MCASGNIDLCTAKIKQLQDHEVYAFIPSKLPEYWDRKIFSLT